MSGKATTTAAITVACQLKTSGNPIWSNHAPTGVLRPKNMSNRKPQTVGGSTIGIVKIASMMLWVRGFKRSVHQAASNPKMKMKMIAVPVVLSVTRRGDQSRVWKKLPSCSKAEGAAAMATASLACRLA